jgi:hypothetical protein
MAESEVADTRRLLSLRVFSSLRRKAERPPPVSPSSKICQKKSKVTNEDEAFADAVVLISDGEASNEAPGEDFSPKAVGTEATTEDEVLIPDGETNNEAPEKGLSLKAVGTEATTEDEDLEAKRLLQDEEDGMLPKNAAANTDDESMPKPVHCDCQGFTKEMIWSNWRLDGVEKVLGGFCYLVGEGCTILLAWKMIKKIHRTTTTPRLSGH